MFDIRNFIEFDSKGRAACPSCEAQGKAHKKNLALIPETDGAYKCHRGCTPAEIRAILGQPKAQQIPAALANTRPQKTVTVSPKRVKDAADRLKGSRQALPWLLNRGFTPEMIEHHRLGAVRSKCGDRHLWAISIPIPAGEGTSYYQKKRVAPWLDESDRPADYQPWSQYGIPASVFITHQPDEPTQTWLCEGEWDAMMLGWAVRHSELKNNVQVACFTCGAGNVPQDDELGKLAPTVISFYDLDDAGERGAQKLASRLGDRCKAAQVPAPDEPESGWDVSDSLNGGFTLANFQSAAAEAKTAEPEPKQSYNPLRARLISNDELIARAPDYVEWLVPDLLTANELFALAAPPRGGKSLFAMTLARCVATGEKFLDRPVTQGPVIYVNLEDSDAKIKEREESQNWQEGLPVYWLDKFKLSEIEHLIELMIEMNPRLVILDTLSRIRSDAVAEGSAEMSMVLEPLQEIAKSLNVCILLVHHTRKIEAAEATIGDIFDTMRGSGAIRATCRGALILAPAEDSYRLVAENGHGKHDLKVRIDPNFLEWRLLGRWNPVVNFDQKEIVLDYMNKVGSATVDQIFEDTQIHKRSLYKVLQRLCADDVLMKTGDRKAAVYHRSAIRLIRQSNSLSNSANEDADCDRSPIRQKKTFSLSDNAENVITFSNCHNGKSDHQTDHPQSDHPCLIEGENGSNPYPESDSAIRQQLDSNLTVKLESLGGDHFLSDSETTVTPEKVITPPDEGDHFGGKGDQFHAVGDHSHDETNSSASFLIGDKVEIRSGRFYGQHVFVEAFLPDGLIQVCKDGWRVKRRYPANELRLLKRADGGESNANG